MVILGVGRAIARHIIRQGRAGATVNVGRGTWLGSIDDIHLAVLVSPFDVRDFGVSGRDARRVQLPERREADQPRSVVLGFAEPAHVELDGGGWSVAALTTATGNLSAGLLIRAIERERLETWSAAGKKKRPTRHTKTPEIDCTPLFFTDGVHSAQQRQATSRLSSLTCLFFHLWM